MLPVQGSEAATMKHMVEVEEEISCRSSGNLSSQQVARSGCKVKHVCIPEHIPTRDCTPRDSDSGANAHLDDRGSSTVFESSLGSPQPSASRFRRRQHGRASLSGSYASPLLSPVPRSPRRGASHENRRRFALLFWQDLLPLLRFLHC